MLTLCGQKNTKILCGHPCGQDLKKKSPFLLALRGKKSRMTY